MVVEILVEEVRPVVLDPDRVQASRGAGAQRPAGIALPSEKQVYPGSARFSWMCCMYLGKKLDHQFRPLVRGVASAFRPKDQRMRHLGVGSSGLPPRRTYPSSYRLSVRPFRGIVRLPRSFGAWIRRVFGQLSCSPSPSTRTITVWPNTYARMGIVRVNGLELKSKAS